MGNQRNQKPKISGGKNIAPQKRNVVAVKVFMTPEEKQIIENRVGDFKSISNLIRYHLGLSSNVIGRRKKLSEDCFKLDDAEIENLLANSFG